MLDRIVALLGILILLPFLLVISILVKLDSTGPVLFLGQRVGHLGRKFSIYKFRSMKVGSAASGPGITSSGDPRVTRIGKTLRATKLDELPQLFNILMGEMSFVGPRPEDPRYVAHYTQDQMVALSVLPGITSPASLAFKNEESLLSGPDWEQKYLKEILPKKLAMDIEYIKSRTIFSDLCVVLRTLFSR